MSSILQSRRGATWKCLGAPKCLSNRVSLPQSENINRQGAKIAKTEMVMWETTDKTSESPRNRVCVLRWKDREHRILGGLGALARSPWGRVSCR
jgi:hypothetical protein